MHSLSRPLTWLARLAALALLTALVSCQTSSVPGSDITDFVNALPSWEELSPLEETQEPEPVGDPSEAEQEIVDDQIYSCTTQQYSITTNPEQVVMTNPNASVIWPGALIQGASHLSASLRPLALDRSRRAPMAISVEGGGVLGVREGVSTTIEQPVASTVREGINQLIANAIEGDVVTGAGFSSFTSVESYSGTQATLELGLSGRYLGGEASAALNYERDASQYTYTAYFIQRLFTMSVDLPESPAALFSPSTSAADLRGLGIGSDNLPLYISSVSYGRILMYSFTSSAERRAIEAAIEFSYNSPVGGVDGYAAVDLERVLENAEIEILAIGGPNTGVVNLIREGNLEAYFDEEIELNQVEPISFNLRNLGDNSLARVSNTTDYPVETCEAVGTVGSEIRSSFDTDVQGWSTFGDATNPRWNDGTADGYIGGYFRATDQAEGTTWFFEASDAYRGDKAAYYGGELALHLISFGAPTTSTGSVRLLGNNGVTLRATIASPGTSWTGYTLPLDETDDTWFNVNEARAATADEIRAVLADVGELRIQGEYVNGADQGGIDEVILRPGPTP